MLLWARLLERLTARVCSEDLVDGVDGGLLRILSFLTLVVLGLPLEEMEVVGVDVGEELVVLELLVEEGEVVVVVVVVEGGVEVEVEVEVEVVEELFVEGRWEVAAVVVVEVEMGELLLLGR